MAQDKQEGLTPFGKVIVFLFIVGLIGAGVYFGFLKKGGGTGGSTGPSPGKTIDMTKLNIEAPDLKGITTVQEYKYVPQEKLPAVDPKAISGYKWDKNSKIVEFPINIWIGWLPIIAANHGHKANKESIFYKKYGFQMNITLIDDPVAARNAFAAGKSHILWGTLDMMVLFAPELMKDSRTAPRIYQQIDWSNGGDGIVVRDRIKSVQDLRGKTVVYAQNSPSQYYINSLLISAGIQPSEVKHKYTNTAFEAAAAFVASTGKSDQIDAVVSWAPDIYNIPEKVKGTKILSTTADANKLIADVWAVRADFAKDHPDIIKGIVAGIFEGMDKLQNESYRVQACQWMADLYGFDVGEIKKMLQDAHSTNFAENKEFFMNANNPANFERTWKTICFVYRELGLIDAPVQFDQVMDFSVMADIEKDGTFAHQKDSYKTVFAPTSFSKVQAEAPILTQTIRINFYPNSSNIFEPQHDELGNALANTTYDPNSKSTLEKVARLAAQFEAATIAIVGHTDGSRKGQVPDEAVKKLSMARANSVKKELVEKYKFDPNKFVVEGAGWDKPFDPGDPENHAKNRRVEISVYQPEAK
ncbi:MAG: phosphate ABC transporter substrate-binding/OmpA family protein [Candidatus Eremiobacteraeota bacterium]|nr:phosphate ABC transporter substrate-binding/OmpA family protein [Candidatus Eremiobacteraeota bacterium]